MGFPGIAFGPPSWKMFHKLCFYWNKKKTSLTEDQKKDIKNWIENGYGKLIPCELCVEHFQTLLKQVPVNFDNLYAWSVEIHNKVTNRVEVDVSKHLGTKVSVHVLPEQYEKEYAEGLNPSFWKHAYWPTIFFIAVSCTGSLEEKESI